MKDKKKRKDPGCRLSNTGTWVVSSPEAKRVLARIERKQARKEARLKQVQKNS